jgi:hypothetical protein
MGVNIMALESLTNRLTKRGGDLLASNKSRYFRANSRFVLFIGDEGAILVYIRDSVVKSRQFIPDTNPQQLETLRENMAFDKKAALLVVVDTIDQSYVQQTLPPVSALSIKKLIRRRLERDFAADDIKGAVVLGREQSGRKDWNFMMISLERTPLLANWINFIDTLPNRFQGFYLVAAESEILIKQLERKVIRSESNSEWKFFVSHNKVSGFRQVILHNGRVVFTRMSQPIGESTPEVMAGNIEQEMLSTIEYMRRLSFDPQSGLDVYIIASSAIRGVLDTAKFNASVKQMHVLTPYEVADHLDIEGATQPADQYGDVVLAASIGRSQNHVLTLHTPQSQKFSQLYQFLIGQRAAAVVFAIGTLLYALGIILSMYTTFLDANRQDAVKVEQQKRLELVRLAIRQSSVDVEKTNDMIELYSQLESERFSPLVLLQRTQQAIKSSVSIKGIEVSYDDGSKMATAPNAFSPAAGIPVQPLATANPASVTATLTMEFPGIGTLEAFKPVSIQLLADLRQALPGFEIAFSRLPSIFSEDEKLDMTFGNNKAASPNTLANQSLDVVLTITGKVAALDTVAEPQPATVPGSGAEDLP